MALRCRAACPRSGPPRRATAHRSVRFVSMLVSAFCPPYDSARALVLRFRTNAVSCHRALAFLIDHRLKKISQPPPHVRVGNSPERTRDPDPFRRAQRLGDGEEAVIGLRRLLASRVILEKERHRHRKDFCRIAETAGADAVASLFVFLHLLESHPELMSQPLLRQTGGKARRPDAEPDMNIDGVRLLASHDSAPSA